jgi:alginate O-acetyltransferase complex protein AlgI
MDRLPFEAENGQRRKRKMTFDSLPFIFFLTFVWLLRRVVHWPGLILLAASIAFYQFAGWRDSLLIFVVIFVNFGASFFVSRGRPYLATIILINIAILAFFKYRGFLFGGVVADDIFVGQILIPLGISFYIFQVTAYQVDLAKGRCAQQHGFWRFVVFVMFFPQLIAGPIMRANELMPQLNRLMKKAAPVLDRGLGIALGLILLGLFKKAGIADSLAPHVDDIFSRGPADSATAWLGAWLFTFQIYFDFSGYSDMAVGIARLFDVRLPFNFRQPYLSKSPREFWQRWHITLSAWIRDYLYIPLGGSRSGGPTRQLAVLVIVMALAGLWHGANWTFIVWGVGWGLFIAVWRPFESFLERYGALGWLLTISAAVILWVFFRSPNLAYAVNYLHAMVGGPGLGDWRVEIGGFSGAWILVGCLCLPLLQVLERWLFSYTVLRQMLKWDGPLFWGLLYALILWIAILPNSDPNPFIYFRF